MTSVVDRIAAQRVVPVLRCESADDAVATARACARAGMTVIELTCTTPDVVRALSDLRGDGLVLGLGTVTDAHHVRLAVAAGVRFVVSFALVEDVLDEAGAAGVTAIPGALTPTEVLRAVSTGAPLVKLFPARVVGPSYLRDLRAVMPGLRVLVTGGIAGDADDMRPWLDAGAVAVGLGSDLGTVAVQGAAEVERRARTALDAVARMPL